jgi:hypothetical protein
MNKLKQIIKINKLYDIWEKEIDSKIDIDWTAILLGNQKFNSCKSKINDKICGTLFNKIDNLLVSNIKKNYE